MSRKQLVIGVDFGTDSVRTVIFDAGDGMEISAAVCEYPRWKQGLFCDAAKNQFRQHPLDYLESFEKSVKDSLAAAPARCSAEVKGISIDTTGSTPVPVNREGVPLALTKEFAQNPNAMFVLWKDHTAVAEAEEINQAARNRGSENFTKFVGGIYSSEWFWAKILHVLRKDIAVRKAAFSWVEHCDWMPAILTGNTDPVQLKRSRCAAGHKAMWHASFRGLPAEDFWTEVDPLLQGLRSQLYEQTWTVETAAGHLSPEWARRLKLSTGVVVGVGAFDAHLGAVGGEIRPGVLCRVMGTSTCDMLVASAEEIGDRPIAGICGQVDGSILPGWVGMEAGQSAFGDIYAWFRDLLQWPLRNLLPADTSLQTHSIAEQILPALSEHAAKLPIDSSGVLALDWMNGRRTPDADQSLKGAIAGLSLGSDAPRIFRALVEATAFGSRALIDRFRSEGVPLDSVIALGGIPKKSPFVMQVVADVLNMPIRVVRSEQACALGSAMAAAAAAGIYPSVEASRDAMGHGFEREFRPDADAALQYGDLYERYSMLGQFVDQVFTRR